MGLSHRNMTTADTGAVSALTREEFKSQVFARDKHRCAFCGEPAVDPHHIMDRKLWSDGSSGYFLNNGASVCSDHHLQCEMTVISVEDVRKACGITEVVLPPGWDKILRYDKWGNEILVDGSRRRGPLFNDDGAHRILAKAGLLGLFYADWMTQEVG